MGSDAAAGTEPTGPTGLTAGPAAEHGDGQVPRARRSDQTRHVRLDAGDVELSGLLAEPDGPPRAVIVGLPGGGCARPTSTAGRIRTCPC
ncbi:MULTISPECIES: hypothetical protein [Protofrankia]|nr:MULTISPECIES: hypothetical protein [Protofrankia]